MRISLLAGFSFLLSGVFAQQVIFEEDFSAGIPSGWTLINDDNLTPAEAVDTFDNAWISFTDGTNLCAASTSYYTPAGQASDYLITPKITLNTFTKLVWSARSYDASYADDYLVLISTTDSLIGSFTDTLMVVEEEYYYWHNRSVQLDLEGYANQDVFIAFKNITTDGYILMLDNVKVLGSDFAAVEENESFDISFFPNPAVDLILINDIDSETPITICDITGNTVYTGYGSRHDISALSAGQYVIRVQSNEKILTALFIKQ